MTISSKGFAHLVLIIGAVLIGILLVVPLPYYQTTSVHCKDDSKCPSVGWNLGDPLMKIIYTSVFNRPSSGPPNEESHLVSITSNPFSNWKTYRNDDYGFKFQYPDDWQVEVVGEEVSDKFLLGIIPTIIRERDYSASNAINIHSYVSPSIEDYMNTYWCIDGKNCFNLAVDSQLGNYPAKKAKYKMMEWDVYRTVAKKDDRVYEISMWIDDYYYGHEFDKEKIYNQIHSSFEFIE